MPTFHSPKDNIEALITQELEYPIIGRDKELNIALEEMKQIIHNPSKGSQRQVILYEGEVGIGKTKILDALGALAYKQKIRYPYTVELVQTTTCIYRPSA